MSANADDSARFVAQILQGQQTLIASHNRLVEHNGMQRLCARMIPERCARRLVQPQRIAAQKCLAKSHQLRAVIYGFAREGRGLLNPAVEIERYRRCLDDSDLHYGGGREGGGRMRL